MKKQTILLLSAAFVLTGCGTGSQTSTSSTPSSNPSSQPVSTPSSEPVSSPSSEPSSLPSDVSIDPSVDPSVPSGEGKFSELSAAILNDHNYTAGVYSAVEGFDDEIYEDTFVNINDDAYYNDYYAGHGGIIRQADQGFVSFLQYSTGAIAPQGFYSTNPEAGASQMYDLVVENLFIGSWVKESENLYSNSNTDAIAVAVSFSGWTSTANVVAPAKIFARVSDSGEDLIVSADFTIWFYDEGEQHPQGNVTITVKNIGSSTNPQVEAYVENPTYTFEAPTAWSNDDKDLFALRFNGKVPSFLEGASYSMCLEEYERSGMTQLLLTDYACGNKLASWGNALVNNDGFTKNSDTKYTLVEKNVSVGKTTTYTVEMAYVSPETARGAHTIGYYYPNGVFQAFLFCKTVNNTVDSVSALNAYITENGLDDYVPLLTFGDICSKVSGFVDKTDAMNQEYGGGYLFYTSTTYIKFYFDSYLKAVAALKSYSDRLKDYGYTRTSAMLGIKNYCLEDDESYIAMTDYSSLTETSYVGYVQMRFNVYSTAKGHVTPVDPTPSTKTLSSLTLTGMSTEYNVNDIFYFDGTATASYSDGSSKVVTSLVELEEYPDMETEGIKTITLSYTEGSITKKANYAISVIDPSKPTTKAPLYLQDNENIVSYRFFDGNGITLTEYDPELDAGYVYASFVCAEGYVVKSLSILEDSSASCQYNEYVERWEIKPSDENLASYTIVAIVEEGGYTISCDKTLVGGSVKLISPSSSTLIEEGYQVRFSVNVEDGYVLDKVFLLEDTSFEISKNPLGTNSYFFNMPAHDATISASFTKEGSEGGESGGKTPVVSSSPLAALGKINLIDTIEDTTFTMSVGFNEDGTGASLATNTTAFGVSSISHTFTWAQTLKEGSTYTINVSNLTQVKKEGTVTYSFKNLTSLEVVYNEALTEVVSVTAVCTYMGDSVRTFVYNA